MKIDIPPPIDLTHPENCCIALLLHPERYSFLLYSATDSEVYFFAEDQPEHLSDALASFKDWYFENDFFSFSFKRVSIITHTNDFTYLPNEIDPEKYAEEFLGYILTDNGGVALHNRVAGCGFSVAYRLPEAVYDFFTRSFEAPEFIHYTVPLIEYFAPKSKTAGAKTMVVDMLYGDITLLCFESDKLLLCNQYQTNRIQDAVYFILFTWKQMKFNQLSDFILLSGNASDNSELTEKLGCFIQNTLSEPIPTGYDSEHKMSFSLAAFAALNS